MIDVRTEGDRVNTLVERDGVTVVVAFDADETEPDDVDEAIADARRELEHQANALFLVRQDRRRRREGSA